MAVILPTGVACWYLLQTVCVRIRLGVCRAWSGSKRLTLLELFDEVGSVNNQRTTKKAHEVFVVLNKDKTQHMLCWCLAEPYHRVWLRWAPATAVSWLMSSWLIWSIKTMQCALFFFFLIHFEQIICCISPMFSYENVYCISFCHFCIFVTLTLFLLFSFLNVDQIFLPVLSCGKLQIVVIWNHSHVPTIHSPCNSGPSGEAFLDFSAAPAVQYLMRRYCTTYSLGSRSSVTRSMHMGATKKLGHNHFYVFLLLALSSFNPPPLYDVTCFSLIIALQVSNEVHRSIKHPYRRMQVQHNTNLSFSIACLSLLLISVLLSWVIDLILLSGEVHPNPGPDSVSSLPDTSTSSSISTLGALSNHLSIMHMNIQSILPTLDLIKCESLAYDVFVFTESWLKPEIKTTTC